MSRRIQRIRTALAVTAVVAVAGASLATTAVATGVDYARTWESGPGGIQVNGYVQFAPYQVNDGIGHVRQAYHRFTRQAGPGLDTGRMYTKTATSRTSRTVYSRQDHVRDSLLPGSAYVTHYHYGFLYFAPACGGAAKTATQGADVAPQTIPC